MIKLNNIDRANICSLYTNGRSAAFVGTLFHISKQRVLDIVRRAGLNARPPGRPRTREHRFTESDLIHKFNIPRERIQEVLQQEKTLIP